jgi:uncharacterized membrane protein
MTVPEGRGTLIGAGCLLGVGMGGMVDGIVLHQILQWHNMLSSRVPPTTMMGMKYNMLWDGLFHAFTWIVTAVGLALLWRARRTPDSLLPTRALVGALALGWGAFNVVEGLIDHQLLGIHHVHPGVAQDAWDAGFLVFGAALAALGCGMLIPHRRDQPRRRAVPMLVRRPG